MSSKSTTSDLNELLSLSPGVYIHSFIGSFTENIPEPSSGFVITHIHVNDNASQWIFYLRGGKYRRSETSGSIGEWVKY